MSEFSVISPAMFNLYKECELKFYYQYVEQVSAPVLDENFSEGKNIHNLAAYYLKGYPVEKYEDLLSEKEAAYWQYLKSLSYFKYEVVGVEKSLAMKVDDFWIGGRIDALVKKVRKGNDYFILDYKTGGVGSDKTFDYQTMVYLLLCDELFEERDSLTFVYLDLKNKKDVKIVFTEALKQEYLKYVKEAYAGMTNISLNKTVCTDMNCAYSKLCNVAGY